LLDNWSRPMITAQSILHKACQHTTSHAQNTMPPIGFVHHFSCSQSEFHYLHKCSMAFRFMAILSFCVAQLVICMSCLRFGKSLCNKPWKLGFFSFQNAFKIQQYGFLNPRSKYFPVCCQFLSSGWVRMLDDLNTLALRPGGLPARLRSLWKGYTLVQATLASES